LTGNAGTNPATNFLGTTDAQPLVIRTNNTEWMRVTANGNVGIGTTGPVAKLDVATGQALFRAGSNFDGSGPYTHNLRFGWAGTDQYQHYIRTRHNAGTTANNAIDFYTSDGTAAGVFPTNAVHGMTITAGNVGIGTMWPWAKLSIEQSGGNSGVGIHRPGVSAGGVAAGLQNTAGISLFSNWWGGFSGEPIRFGWATWNGDWNNFTEVMRIRVSPLPSTSNLVAGVVVPMPTLPETGTNATSRPETCMKVCIVSAEV
jgi:hypothetical protein